MPRPYEHNRSSATDSETQKDQPSVVFNVDFTLPSWLIDDLALWGCENPWWRDMNDIRWSPDFPSQPIRAIGWFEDEEDGSYHMVTRHGNAPRQIMTEEEWNRLTPWEGKAP